MNPEVLTHQHHVLQFVKSTRLLLRLLSMTFVLMVLGTDFALAHSEAGALQQVERAVAPGALVYQSRPLGLQTKLCQQSDGTKISSTNSAPVGSRSFD